MGPDSRSLRTLPMSAQKLSIIQPWRWNMAWWNVKNTDGVVGWTWIWIPALLVASCVTLNKLLDLFLLHKMSIRLSNSKLLGRLSKII
jgi:hypothetical protein